MTDTIDAVMADEVVNQQQLAEQLLAQANTSAKCAEISPVGKPLAVKDNTI